MEQFMPGTASQDLRQQRVEGMRAYRFGGWALNLNTRQLVSPNRPHAALTLSRTRLLELSRVHGDEVYDRAVDVLIMRLRRKLGDDSAHPRCIVTMRGAGYRVGVPVQTVY